jgi:hypothetical protein
MLLYFCMFVILGWLSQFGSCIVVCIAFLVEWYIVSFFSIVFVVFSVGIYIFLAAKFVSVGIGGDLQVLSMVLRCLRLIHPYG